MIYIIEDDMSVRRSFEIFLESAGMKYKSFETAEAFLSGTVLTTHDLLLLDINLPSMSGLDLLAMLAKEVKRVPAIVITAMDNSHLRENCRRYGVKAFLRKPVDSEALIDLIKYNMPS